MTLRIQKSMTADTRTCDFSKVSKQQLLESSIQHKGDILLGMNYFANALQMRAINHDNDKLTAINHFHSDFLTGFKETGWWDNHRKITRHHLLQADGVPEDVNLIDVIEMIVDCVMAGMGRSGSVYPLDIAPEIVMKAFVNTAELLKMQITVEQADAVSQPTP